MKTIILAIDGMTCSACSNGLEKYMNKQNGIFEASVNLVMANATITYDEQILNQEKIEKYIKQAGFKSLGIFKELNIEKNNKKEPLRGENVETEINSTIYEAFYGLDKKISLRTIDGRMKTFTVAIPQGIRNGEKIRLIGQGKPGINGAKNGDLFIKINIQDDKKFKLRGCDIYTDLQITPWEAALGTRVNIQSIDEETKVYIPQGIQSGEIVRIPNKGYKDGKGTRGDLIAEVKIMVPKKLSEQERKKFEELNKISTFNPREK